MNEREASGANLQGSVTVSWLVPDEDKENLVDVLKDVGKIDSFEEKTYEPKDPDEIEASEFSPLIIIVGVIAISYLADVIIKLIKDIQHSGLIAVAKENGELEIRENASLNRGEVLFVDAKGKASKFQFNDASTVDIMSALKALV